MKKALFLFFLGPGCFATAQVNTTNSVSSGIDQPVQTINAPDSVPANTSGVNTGVNTNGTTTQPVKPEEKQEIKGTKPKSVSSDKNKPN